MPPLIVMDVHEDPKDKGMERLLSTTLQVVRQNLEPLNLADYCWHTDIVHTVELKEAEAAIMESGARLDAQLTKYQHAAEDIWLFIQNPITANPDGSCKVWKRRNMFFIPGKTLNKEYTTFMAYIYSLAVNEGIHTLFTADMSATAWALSSFVYNSHKPAGSHTTLRKHLKPRVATVLNPESPFEAQPFVETLMGIKNARIGEKTALKLISRFKTPFDLAVASVDDVAEVIGLTAAELYFKSIGRMP